MITKSNLGVEVSYVETEIIESTETVKNEERRFGVGNGDKEIIAEVWGSDDNQTWEKDDSKTIDPGDYATLRSGPSHHPFVKLTGRTTVSGEMGIVDGYLIYNEP
ncbi:MAG: hypothetical protein JSV56_09435 [Methanomassiliicoccales archaeon]|nr:MAG: hypothetical protein JSV56_09435 [Methanomassiliicoccales archaeon]